MYVSLQRLCNRPSTPQRTDSTRTLLVVLVCISCTVRFMLNIISILNCCLLVIVRNETSFNTFFFLFYVFFVAVYRRQLIHRSLQFTPVKIPSWYFTSHTMDMLQNIPQPYIPADTTNTIFLQGMLISSYLIDRYRVEQQIEIAAVAATLPTGSSGPS